MKTMQDIALIFETHHNLITTEYNKDWFNKIAADLMDGSELTNITPKYNSGSRPPVDTKVTNVMLYNPVMVVFNMLYPSIIVNNTTDDMWNWVEFRSMYKMMYTNRKKYYNEFSIEVITDMKAWINMVYGMLFWSTCHIKCSVDIGNIITTEVKKLILPLYEHTNAVYCDTDFIIFNNITPKSVQQIMKSITTNIPYDIISYDVIGVCRTKQIILGTNYFYYE